jgi:hypothetical protein
MTFDCIRLEIYHQQLECQNLAAKQLLPEQEEGSVRQVVQTGHYSTYHGHDAVLGELSTAFDLRDGDINETTSTS